MRILAAVKLVSRLFLIVTLLLTRNLSATEDEAVNISWDEELAAGIDLMESLELFHNTGFEIRFEHITTTVPKRSDIKHSYSVDLVDGCAFFKEIPVTIHPENVLFGAALALKKVISNDFFMGFIDKLDFSKTLVPDRFVEINILEDQISKINPNVKMKKLQREWAAQVLRFLKNAANSSEVRTELSILLGRRPGLAEIQNKKGLFSVRMIVNLLLSSTEKVVPEALGVWNDDRDGGEISEPDYSGGACVNVMNPQGGLPIGEVESTVSEQQADDSTPAILTDALIHQILIEVDYNKETLYELYKRLDVEQLMNRDDFFQKIMLEGDSLGRIDSRAFIGLLSSATNFLETLKQFFNLSVYSQSRLAQILNEKGSI